MYIPFFVLGAVSAQMNQAEKILSRDGAAYGYAVDADGNRVGGCEAAGVTVAAGGFSWEEVCTRGAHRVMAVGVELGPEVDVESVVDPGFFID